VLGGALEPAHAPPRSLLTRLDGRAPRGLVRREGVGDRPAVAERAVEGDGVLDRELGAGADREVDAVRGVADEHDVLVHPAPAPHDGEAGPAGAVSEERRSLELRPEEARERRERLLLRALVESGAAAGRLVALDDERARAGPVGIGVRDEEAELARL